MHEQVVLFGPIEGDHDVFDTQAATKDLGVAPGLLVRSTDIEIEQKMVVGSQTLTGLCFTLVKFRDKWSIKASLPKHERPADVREHFAPSSALSAGDLRRQGCRCCDCRHSCAVTSGCRARL